MNERGPTSKPARLVRVFAFPVALFGMVACATVLGIDDRSLVDTGPDAEGGGGNDGNGGGGGEGGAGDANDAETSKAGGCHPMMCKAVGGTCSGTGVCVIDCPGAANCASTVIECPPDTDCEIKCLDPNNCFQTQCVGGRSCTFDCAGDKSCTKASCESDTCTFNCTAMGCNDGLISCDAGSCTANCGGMNACKGVDFHASSSCAINCTGMSSCGGAPIACAAPISKIDCHDKESCKEVKPTCMGPPKSRCEIDCPATGGGCNKKACCNEDDAGCTLVNVMNACP